MVDAIKKMDRKFLIIVGVIILVPLLIIVFLAIIQGCSNRKLTYDKYEENMVSAAEKYFKSGDKLPTNEGELKEVKLSTLVEKGYIKDSTKALKDNCKGNVTVRLNGASVEANEGGYLNYIVNLSCDNYKTKTLFDKIKESVVKSGEGLYKTEVDYVYKGEDVKNYLSMYDKTYRIISIDNDGILKLVRSDTYDGGRLWDNKYNTETGHANGITIFKDSRLLKYMLIDYANEKKFSKDARKHIIAYDVCIGSRDISNLSISKELDCSTKLEKQLVSLVNVSDFARASLDSNCTDIVSRSCNNYNYLSKELPTSWTLNTVSGNTHEVYYVGSAVARYTDASEYNDYGVVVYVDGNEKYVKGKGSTIDPYVVE